MTGDIDSAIKKGLTDAKVYVEVRGLRIDVQDISTVTDIKKLIDIKL